MATEGIAAALSLDPQTLPDLDKAQQIVTQMADAAERLATGFSGIQSSVKGITSAFSGMNLSASFDPSGVVHNISIITDAVAKANQTQQNNAKATTMSEESLNKKLENILTKRADSYNAITQRIKEIKDYQEKWNAASAASAKNSGAAFDVKNYQAAEKYLSSLKDRLRAFNYEFNSDRAVNVGNNALSMSEDTYQNALSKLKALTLARDEFLKPGGDSAQESGWINNVLKQIDEEIERIKGNLPALKEAAEENLLRGKAQSIETQLSAALDLPENTVDEIRDKIGQIKAAYINLTKEAAKNKFIDPFAIETAKENLDGLRQSLSRLNKDTAIKNVSGGLQRALGLDENSLEQIRSKIAVVKGYINQLRRVAGDKMNESWIYLANKDLDKMNAKLKVAEMNMNMTSKAASQVGNMLKSAFSIALITSFAKNVVSIRGEFEMAEKSIGIIIKDANMAKDIFSQIQNIAIRSPFQIKDLVKQTKQLAAYRIETDKLVETTKMLGDIASGVGVDMNRLILAYGQVKATTYLKGTELRQFSEAGVNMLGGLAERMSELQKRTVSTGEVLQMVSKRMISFADVDAVLRKETAAGGTFYKMQEQQAATLQGRISNIRDKMDVMFNEIGKSTQGFITTILDLIDMLIKNYALIEPIFTGGLVFKFVLAISGGLGKIYSWMKNIRTLIIGIGTASKGLIGVLAGFGPIIATVAALAVAITTVVLHAKKLQLELKRTAKEAKQNTDDMISDFTRLSIVVGNTNKSLEERNKAFEEMKSQFGNILPLEKENITTIGYGTEKYREYADAIREANAEMLQEKLILTVIDDLNNSVEKRAERVQRVIAGTGSMFSEFKKAKEDVGDYNLDAFIEIQNRAISGEIKSAEEAAREYAKLIDEFYSFSDGYTEDQLRRSRTFSLVVEQFEDVFKRLDAIPKSIDKGFGLSDYGFDGRQLGQAIKDIQKYKEEWKNFYRYVEDESGKAVYNPQFNGNEAALEQAADKAAQDYIETLRKAIETGHNVEWGELNGAFGVRMAEAVTLSDSQKTRLTSALGKQAGKIAKGASEEMLLGVFADINAKFPELQKQFGSGDWALNAGESVEAFAKRMREAYDTIQDNLKAWNNYADALEKGSTEYNAFMELHGGERDTIEAESLAMKVLIDWFDKFGIAVGNAGKNTKDTSSDFRNFVKEVSNATEEFKKLDAAGDKILENKLKALAAKVHASLPESYKAEDVAKWYESLKKKFQGKLNSEEWLEFDLEFNERDTERKLESYKERMDSLWEKFNTAKKFEGYGLELPGFNSAKIISQIMDLEKELKAIEVKEAEDAAEESAKKRLDILMEQNEKAAKLIAESERKAADEVTQIYEKLYKDIAEMRAGQKSSTNVNGIDKDTVDKAVSEATTKAMRDAAKAQWDAYKSTEMYAMAFGDLENISKPVLEGLLSQLKAFKQNMQLNPSDMRSVERAIKNLEDQKNRMSDGKFMSAFSEAFRDAADAINIYKNELPSLSNAANLALDRQAQAKAALDIARSAAEANPEDPIVKSKLAKAEKDMADATQEASEATNEYSEAQKKANSLMSNAKKKVDAVSSAYNSVGSAISETISLAQNIAEAFGLATDPETQAAIEGFEKGFQLVGAAISVVSAALTVAKIIGDQLMATLWPLLVIGAALGAIMAIISAKDAQREKVIEAHKRAVERLQKAYEDLEETFERVLSMGDASNTYNAMMANLKRQYIELSEAIAANNNSKQTDKVKEETEDLMEQLEEVKDKMKEAQEQKMELLGANNDYQDIASDWSSSWLDAFKDTGDGLDALRGDFDNFYDDIVSGQIQSLIMGPALKKLEEMVKATLSDWIVTDEEAAALQNYRDTVLAGINEESKLLAKKLGVKAGTDEGDTLQKGIEAVSEQTAQALESILNSTRFYVADNNRALLNIEQVIVGEGENTILANLRAQTNYLRALSTIADAVYYSGAHSKGAGGIKVFVD